MAAVGAEWRRWERGGGGGVLWVSVVESDLSPSSSSIRLYAIDEVYAVRSKPRSANAAPSAPGESTGESTGEVAIPAKVTGVLYVSWPWTLDGLIIGMAPPKSVENR